MCEDVEHSPGDRVQDRQAVDPVLDEGVDSFEQAVEVGAVSLGQSGYLSPCLLPLLPLTFQAILYIMASQLLHTLLW